MKVRSPIFAIAAALLGIVAVLGFCSAPRASADFKILGFDGRVDDATGDPYTQAGGHPFKASTVFKISSHPDSSNSGTPVPDEDIKTIRADLPPGFVGNPSATAKCQADDLFRPLFEPPTCPPNTQVGYTRIDHGFFGSLQSLLVPVYNIVPANPDNPAEFGFKVLTTVIKARASVRTGGDYGVSLEFPNVGEGLALIGSEFTLWGVPGDPAHNVERGSCLTSPAPANCPSGGEPRPLVTLPTSCTPAGVGLETGITFNSWEQPGTPVKASFMSHLAPYYPEPGAPGPQQGTTGCDAVPFKPSFEIQPRGHRADAPVGLDVNIELPQQGNPVGVETAHLKRAEVVFPEGMTVNPATADGLSGCSEAEIALDSSAAPSCPDASKLGTVEIETPLLEEPLRGSIYLARQNENKFGSLLALYIAAEGGGVRVKLPGEVKLDAATGRVTAVFDDNPQLPFETLKLAFKGGDRAPLITPSGCGTYTTEARLTSWSRPGEVVRSDSSFTIDQGCGGGFAPGFSAGTVDPAAGHPSPFKLRITGADGEQNLAGLDVTLPEGVVAKLAGVPVCGDAEAAAGGCPSGSQVGSVTVGVGAGSSPLFIPQLGKAPTGVYLAGPYRGAPYSLAIKVPAQAGPFDLGMVAVRTALHVDPVTAQVTAKSDPLPQILEGIPVSYRDVRVSIDRADFVRNPTSCEAMSVAASLRSSAGSVVSRGSHFEAANCAALPFEPKIALRFFGKTHRAAHPKLRAVVTAREGDANIGAATVVLPKTEFLENAHIRTVCTRVQYAANACPQGAIYGYAKAWTPLLAQPLEGPVYLRSNGGERTLPDLVADLNGQIDIDLVGYIDSKHKRIRNRFFTVPDAPVSRFMLTMQGARKGLLANNTELCKAKPRANVRFVGQNGAVQTSKPRVKIGCGKKHGKRHGGKQHRRK